MHLSEVVLQSLASFRAHKVRTGLTMLGMIIGVLAVVLLVSVGQGAKNYIFGEFEGLGSNLLAIQPGKSERRGMMGPPVGSARRRLTREDVRALRFHALSVEAVSGLVLGTAELRYEDNISTVSVFGVDENFPEIITMPIAVGQFFSAEENESSRRVVVLGANIATSLFANENPVGRMMRINRSQFRVSGVLQAQGNKLGFDMDEIIFIPTGTAMRIFDEDRLFGIRAKARSMVGIDDAAEEVAEVLRERRGGDDDFTIMTQISMMESMGTILNMMTYVLGAIAGISMLVGGIGIMNIMLVSVTERTEEIGIRRALGARRHDILAQFLVEGVILSVIGGLIGVFAAVAITWGLFFSFPAFDLRAPLWIIGPAFGVSVLVGTIFGVWPAKKAAAMEVLAALRHK